MISALKRTAIFFTAMFLLGEFGELKLLSDANARSRQERRNARKQNRAKYKRPGAPQKKGDGNSRSGRRRAARSAYKSDSKSAINIPSRMPRPGKRTLPSRPSRRDQSKVSDFSPNYAQVKNLGIFALLEAQVGNLQRTNGIVRYQDYINALATGIKQYWLPVALRQVDAQSQSRIVALAESVNKLQSTLNFDDFGDSSNRGGQSDNDDDGLFGGRSKSSRSNYGSRNSSYRGDSSSRFNRNMSQEEANYSRSDSTSSVNSTSSSGGIPVVDGSGQVVAIHMPNISDVIGDSKRVDDDSENQSNTHNFSGANGFSRNNSPHSNFSQRRGKKPSFSRRSGKSKFGRSSRNPSRNRGSQSMRPPSNYRGGKPQMGQPSQNGNNRGKGSRNSYQSKQRYSKKARGRGAGKKQSGNSRRPSRGQPRGQRY